MDDVLGAFASEAAGLYMFNEGGDLSELHPRGVPDKFLYTYEIFRREQDPIFQRAMATRAVAHDGTVFESADAWTRSALYRECAVPWKFEHYMCVPVVAGGRVIAALDVARKHDVAYSREEMEAATRMAALMGSRLHALASDPEDSVADFGRLWAARTRARVDAEAPCGMGADEAGALWDAVVTRQLTPLDYFEKGDRTYLLLAGPDPADAGAAAQLTRRELEVVGRAAAGCATKEIAHELSISHHTVGTVLTSARRKLGVRSRVKLVELARRLGLAH